MYTDAALLLLDGVELGPNNTAAKGHGLFWRPGFGGVGLLTEQKAATFIRNFILVDIIQCPNVFDLSLDVMDQLYSEFNPTYESLDERAEGDARYDAGECQNTWVLGPACYTDAQSPAGGSVPPIPNKQRTLETNWLFLGYYGCSNMLEQINQIQLGVLYWTIICFKQQGAPPERIDWDGNLPFMYIGEGIVDKIAGYDAPQLYIEQVRDLSPLVLVCSGDNCNPAPPKDWPTCSTTPTCPPGDITSQFFLGDLNKSAGQLTNLNGMLKKAGAKSGRAVGMDGYTCQPRVGEAVQILELGRLNGKGPSPTLMLPLRRSDEPLGVVLDVVDGLGSGATETV